MLTISEIKARLEPVFNSYSVTSATLLGRMLRALLLIVVMLVSLLRVNFSGLIS